MRLKRILSLNVEEISGLLQESREQGFRSPDTLVREYQDGSNQFDLAGEALFGVYEGETLVGIGGLNIDPFLFDPLIGRVRHVHVLSAYRRTGVGKMLLDAIIDEARKHFKLLTLRTKTQEASAFYKSLGFQTEPRIEMATHHLQLTLIPYFPTPVVRYAS